MMKKPKIKGKKVFLGEKTLKNGAVLKVLCRTYSTLYTSAGTIKRKEQ